MSKVQTLRGLATVSFFANDVKAARRNRGQTTNVF